MDWHAAITAAATHRGTPVVAVTYLAKWDSASHPVLWLCADNREYVVKGPHATRQIVNDQVVGRIGRALGAPVGEVGLVDVPTDLIAAQPGIQDRQGGVSHGCVFVRDCTEKAGVDHVAQDENRSRFARLAVLYSWIGANDQQLIYRKMPPHLVYSVDHGHFFPGGPNWTAQSLASAPPAVFDSFFDACGLTKGDKRDAAGALHEVTEEVIASAVAVPLDPWGVTLEERVAIAEYLMRRRAELYRALVGA